MIYPPYPNLKREVAPKLLIIYNHLEENNININPLYVIDVGV
jgi:hypothetical protein